MPAMGLIRHPSAAFTSFLVHFIVLSFDTTTVLSRPILGKASVANAEIISFHFLHQLSSPRKGEALKGIRQLKQYLRRFGYVNYYEKNSVSAADDDTFDELLESSLKTYQRYFSLDVTGIPDSQTLQQMMKQRCGVPDMNSGSTSMLSGSSVSLFSFFRNRRWPASQTHLTYGFLPWNNRIINIDRGKLSRVCRRAFARWSAVTHFTFEEVKDYGGAEMRIGFFRGAHGDGADFDGRGGVLAHAFAPTAGIFHLDGDETWSTTTTTTTDPGADETDLESVAVHEIGHLLGLGHSSVRDAVMYPTIPRGVKKVNLHGDDIDGIRALYNL
ncbi:hypothetical protein H6P81_009615 [Aristolochia fimbriata]|uniref:Peptidase metallopeptidase domain-containing protein n=1 Tax=Aristolochia fimbriata TaxID=158543 RepID=A0AAV7ENG1_ARIFI|nr:hypothetical protein H6P81_009615 [Aristolochia fimbriata]